MFLSPASTTSPAASWAAYQLTSFVQDSALMVGEAVVLLQAATASARPFGGHRRVLPSRLVERNSTARPTGHGTLVSPPY